MFNKSPLAWFQIHHILKLHNTSTHPLVAQVIQVDTSCNFHLFLLLDTHSFVFVRIRKRDKKKGTFPLCKIYRVLPEDLLLIVPQGEFLQIEDDSPRVLQAHWHFPKPSTRKDTWSGDTPGYIFLSAPNLWHLYHAMLFPHHPDATLLKKVVGESMFCSSWRRNMSHDHFVSGVATLKDHYGLQLSSIHTNPHCSNKPNHCHKS